MDSGWTSAAVALIAAVLGGGITVLTETGRSRIESRQRRQDEQIKLAGDLTAQCISALGTMGRGVDAIRHDRWEAFVAEHEYRYSSDGGPEAHFAALADGLFEVRAAALVRYPQLHDRQVAEFIETAYTSAITYLEDRARIAERHFPGTVADAPQHAMETLVWAAQERIGGKSKFQRLRGRSRAR